MRVLIIGGTGLISRGIIKHLLARNAEVAMLNRGRRLEGFEFKDVEQISLDRENLPDFERIGQRNFDVVIDMICFTPTQAQSDVRAFGGRCAHFIFCSTVCTYGAKIPPGVLIDETFKQEPISEYGRNKLAAESVFREAHVKGIMPCTIIRPSHTYGPENPLIDNLEPDPVAWDRIERGLPILCAGDGLGLWVATHRADCGKLFAYAAMNPKTFGQEYNATRDHVFTWRDYFAQVGQALGKPVQALFVPAGWIVAHDPRRFNLLNEITQFHGAYDSGKARRDVPQFNCEIEFVQGAAQTLVERRRRKLWRSGENDPVYEAMIQKALNIGVKPITLP
jgi:nucleoside-diphosphate-sugar epimerase